MSMLRALLAFTIGLSPMATTLSAQAVEITLPQETAAFRQSTMPGYVAALRNCMICHSAQYVLTQPPTLPRSYWEATVKKMKMSFGAPFPEEDIPIMVDYLVKTYGAEQATPAPAQEKPAAH